MKRSKEFWDLFYLEQAKKYSEASKDPSTKVGAILIDRDNRIISAGCNGLPRGIRDSKKRLKGLIKYKIIIHAEVNAILYARANLSGCTVYTYPLYPCSVCAAILIQAGIERVVSVNKPNIKRRWVDSMKLSRKLFKEAGVQYKLYDYF